MTTAATRTSNSKTALNGVSRQVKALRQRASTETKALRTEVERDTRALRERAGKMLATATRVTRDHPWTAAGVLAATAALVGGYFWASRRR